MASIKQYEKAMAALSDKRKQILIKLYLNAPFGNTNEIALVLGYLNFNAANLQIGSIGSFISKTLSVPSKGRYEHKGEVRNAYFTLVHEYTEEGWQLIGNLARAMENVGLVKSQHIKPNVQRLETEISEDEITLRKEGKIVQVFVNKYERDKKLVRECLNFHGRI
jgi:predicted HNH restriction endonuclease